MKVMSVVNSDCKHLAFLFRREEHDSWVISNNAILNRTKRQDFKNSKTIKPVVHLVGFLLNCQLLC